MQILRYFGAIITIIFLPNFLYASIKITNLRCEYLKSPIGVDSPSPRFAWEMNTDEYGISQVAYRLQILEEKDCLKQEKLPILYSETVNSNSNNVQYNGESLKPFTRYYWQVSIKDNLNRWTLSPIDSFETGMLDENNWQGKWISDNIDLNLKPAPYFRKGFKLEKTVRSARVYIAVAGLYELTLNGKRVGDHILDPMFTRFDRRTLYISYDITKQLETGENVIGVLLGNGWYNHQSHAVWYFDKAPWRARPKFCMDLKIDFIDGTSQTISTDETWQTHLSPVIFNSIYTGEHYDARLEQKGWDKPGFNPLDWINAIQVSAPSQKIVSQVIHPIKLINEIKPIKLKKLKDDVWLFDFGRNISGITQLKISGSEGTILRLKHTERIDSTGYADLSNIDVHFRPIDDSDPFQTDIYILKGIGEEVFMPKFNYKGFQYVEISCSDPVELTKENLSAFIMHSDVPSIGKIHCSNEIVNRIWEASNNSYLYNLFGYPTDCPQREKNGWTGDAHINIETGLYNYDAITIYEKWMNDHCDEQQPNGILPAIIPTSGWGYHWANGPDWTSSIAIIPWNLYLFYGDISVLDQYYKNIKNYVDYIDKSYPEGLVDWGLGDWIPVKSITKKEFTSTIYFFVDVDILCRAAKILGKTKDYHKYKLLADKIKNNFNSKYFNKSIGIYGEGSQTELSMALHWKIVPEELREQVALNLAKRVEKDNFHIDVGLLGSKTILNALSDNGYEDHAFKLASRETYPSWGWWIKNGATTFYENWDINNTQDISMNHIMFGEINAWFYKALGGIKPDPQNPGFKNVILTPKIVNGLDNFHACFNGPYGKISSYWERCNGDIEYTVEIPPNSSAELILDSANVKSLICNGVHIKDSNLISVGSIHEEKMKLHFGSGKYFFKWEVY